MKYPTIRIEGSILSADILDKIQQGELLGQKPKDFWMEGSGKVKDEIVKAWADAQDMWRIYQRRTESIPETKTGTSETRNYWMVPLLSLLGYDMQLYRSAQIINDKSYAISHNAANLDAFAIHIMGFNDSLDKKRRDSGPRMSPHALVQEYINLNEHLYALVTNGLTIRLLRDSSRLIKLSFLEFDLERMFNEDHYTDFAVMYRLLHASRMPRKQAEGAESLIEGYHQDSLDSGSRIREGLSNAVEISIESIANGFLDHPDNEILRQNIEESNLTAVEYYSKLLHLIYRLLFLMVIEERGLIFEDDVPKEKRDIYYDYYSINRVRNLSEKRYLAEAKHSDLWISIKNTFRLFETEYFGAKLQIKPLAGDLFGSNAIGLLNNCSLDNKVLLNCLKNLSIFTNPNTGQKMRVNYGSLNTEEFGSVYENLLEYDPHLESIGNNIRFSFIKGSGRSSSGSHYTPDELVQPLIKHSLDYVIEEKLKESEVASSEVANSEIVDRSLSVNEIKLILGENHGKKSILSRPDRVAKSNGSGGNGVRPEEIFSQTGNVRNDQSNAQSRNFDPSQYRRRLGQKLYERIHSFSQDSSGQFEGIGNTSSSLRSHSLTERNSDTTSNESQQRNWQNAAVAYLQSQKPQAVLKLLPDSTRYLLLANRSLLSITVCDVACGSGHILLNAARRIATQLAKVRTGEDQPSPSAFRQAVRDVIRHCIYGVDKNPLAVKLAKVALWLEAHNPGEPLNFLDHHIKCGDAIVGLAHKEELQNGIPNEAFKKLPGDDKDISKELRDRNKQERKRKQELFDFSGAIKNGVNSITNLFHELDNLPERTPTQIEAKRQKYQEITSGQNFWNLKLLADIMTAQFFIPKTTNNQRKVITDAKYRGYLRGEQMIGEAVGQAEAEAAGNRFFHWFLEFPEVFQEGGFDCILGNPPFRGGLYITNDYSIQYTQYIKANTTNAGATSDLVSYFFRRIYNLIKDSTYMGLIGTNSISEGDTRVTGLESIINLNGSILMAVRSIRWPGKANLTVSLLSIAKNEFSKDKLLDNIKVKIINSRLLPSDIEQKPNKIQHDVLASLGTTVYGNGFFLDNKEARNLINMNADYVDYIKPFLNGDDVLKAPIIKPLKHVFYFQDMNLEELKRIPDLYNIAFDRIFPQRQKSSSKRRREKWWLYTSPAEQIYKSIIDLDFVFVTCFTSKYMMISKVEKSYIYSNAVIVFSTDNFVNFNVIQSALHECWVRKYSSTLETRLRYAVSDCYYTFPFPQNLSAEMEGKLERVGQEYHEFRRQLLQKLQLGLTKTYNQFHNALLTSEIVSSEKSEIANSEIENSSKKVSNGYSLIANRSLSKAELTKRYGKDTYYLWNHLQKTPGTCTMEEAVAGITKLRQLHKEMDEAVLEAYGWGTNSTSDCASAHRNVEATEKTNIPKTFHSVGHSEVYLAHDFYEVDYLPENDRVRYTINPEARKEVLKRLLLLNHKIYEEEVKQGLHKKGKRKKEKEIRLRKASPGQGRKAESRNQKSERPKSIKIKDQRPKTKEKPQDTSQMDMFSTISAPEPETPPTEEGLLTSFHVGQHVFHDKFGEGEILHIAGSGVNARLTVRFGKEMKKLVAGYAKLRGV